MDFIHEEEHFITKPFIQAEIMNKVGELKNLEALADLSRHQQNILKLICLYSFGEIQSFLKNKLKVN